MAKFTQGVEVVTSTPTVTVDGGLPAGVYRFQLVVEDATDRTRPPVASAPKILTLQIRSPLVIG
ncbi:MAG TPA: hypothetical protein VFF06_01995 [Polyangia bacterium]|nr:hypothetical protein [Polyangia bacterium]